MILADFVFTRFEDGAVVVNMAPPVAIGAWSILFEVTKRFGGESGLITKSVASGYNAVSGITILSSGQGQFQVSLKSSETSGWDCGNFAVAITRVDSGYKTVLDEGYMLLVP